MIALLTRPSGPRARRAAYVLVAAAVTLLAIFEGLRAGTPGFPYDDSYIVLHNARVVGAGHDTSYEGVSPLFGATSAVHLFLVALVSSVATPAWASFIVASIGAVAYALGLLRLGFAHGWSAPLASLLVILGLTLAEVPHQLYNGLETGLAMAAITWTLATHAALPRPRWALVLLGVLPFLRPELAALTFALTVSVVVDRYRRREEWLQNALRDVALVLLGAAPWMLWYLVETGAPWAQTAVAKRAFFAEECLPPPFRRMWLAQGISGIGALIGVFSVAGLLLARTRLGRISLGFFGLMAATYYARMPSAFWQYEHRYLYVTVPFFFYAAAAAWQSQRKWLRAFSVAIVLAGLVQSVPGARARYQGHLEYCRVKGVEYQAVAAWLRANLPPRARVLVHDAGFMSEATDLALTDLVGLKSPSSIPVNVTHVLSTCGRDRALATDRIATTARAEYMVVLEDWNALYFKFGEALLAHGWSVERRYVSPGSLYEVYALEPRGGIFALDYRPPPP